MMAGSEEENDRMAGKHDCGLRLADVTPKAQYFDRRRIMAGVAGLAAAGLAGGPMRAIAGIAAIPSPYSTDEKPNPKQDIESYNNFYEFGTGKSDPAKYAGGLTTHPWSVKIDGLVERPGDYDLDDLLKGMQMEERIYRLRCVEAWSMVVPWAGFELRRLLERVGVRSGAKYVAFETLLRPSQMPGQKTRILEWPYREGLRLDEAMHPLTILATGIYGEPLAPQCGAPIRLVVPWKYGFKSIKSIVRMTLTDKQPVTTWNQAAPGEYGFYANVNPEVDHPRWSQATERRIGDGFFARRRPTLPFNGYAEEVAHLYKGMDLKKYF